MNERPWPADRARHPDQPASSEQVVNPALLEESCQHGLDRPLTESRPRKLEHATGVVCALAAHGTLVVELDEGRKLECELLLNGALPPAPGDRVLVLAPTEPRALGIVLGRVGPCPSQGHPKSLLLEASDQLSLKCGESSIDLRADGKVMIRGEDVLVRAKGTQRIRAGTVSIN